MKNKNEKHFCGTASLCNHRKMEGKEFILLLIDSKDEERIVFEILL